MSWVSFWLDPNAVPGRTTLGTSTWLTMITLTRNTGSDQLPKVSNIIINIIIIIIIIIINIIIIIIVIIINIINIINIIIIIIIIINIINTTINSTVIMIILY